MRHFILDASRQAVAVDLLAWGRWVGRSENREVARTEIGHLLVLTCFAGIDLSFGEGPPAFFETRVLDGLDALECGECSTWEDALAGHQALVDRWSGWTDAAWDATRRLFADR